ncbi:helix-turn-helix domain-containing protein [Sphingomonas sp. AP4-R1]|uniref:helix-turn-helix domain-containing protein n=1 Tax=Sphingomonas sp. AP4-R1 TaxID=2735134 RepID=UPI001493B86E|nr:helix-turn-helix domain-containing protein [Sphingomonas sp. AP4-R1]QJU59547.1 helix-turn-helix domain-containing protein [Sphingomonas sp. AP4-R1]
MNEIRNGLAEATATTVGGQLRAAREAQGLSLGEIAERTRIPTRHLTALENDDHQGLPAATYSTGFVKTYARMLGLDGQELAQQFRGELTHAAPRIAYQEVYQPADPARTPSRGLVWVSLLAVVVLVLGFLYWRGMHSEDPVAVASAPPAESPAPALPAAKPQAPAATPTPATAGGPAVLTAESPVWLRVTDGDGKLFEGMLDTGKSFTVPDTAADPRLLTGRPNALKVTVGSSVIPPLGPPEQRVRNVSLKPEALLERLSGGTGERAVALIPDPVNIASDTDSVPVRPAPAPTSAPATPQAGPN